MMVVNTVGVWVAEKRILQLCGMQHKLVIRYDLDARSIPRLRSVLTLISLLGLAFASLLQSLCSSLNIAMKKKLSSLITDIDAWFRKYNH